MEECLALTEKLFRDAPFMILFVFLAIIMIMLPYFNPPKEDEESEAPGNVAVQVVWQPGYESDVDLHLMGPGSPVDVYYRRKSGPVWNLLRDDLGVNADPMPANFENAYTRGVPAGRYVINVRCYRCPEHELPVEVAVVVEYRKDMSSSLVELHRETVHLVHDTQELTVVQFLIDEDGDLVPGSKSNLFVPMWNSDKRRTP